MSVTLWWELMSFRHLVAHILFATYMQIPSRRQTDKVQCYEPATMKYLGYFPALKPDEVSDLIMHAVAEDLWVLALLILWSIIHSSTPIRLLSALCTGMSFQWSCLLPLPLYVFCIAWYYIGKKTCTFTLAWTIITAEWNWWHKTNMLRWRSVWPKLERHKKYGQRVASSKDVSFCGYFWSI